MSTTSRLVQRLRERGSMGADLSPGDPLCAAAADEIERLDAGFNAMVKRLKQRTSERDGLRAALAGRAEVETAALPTEDARVAASVTGFLEHTEKHGLLSERQLQAAARGNVISDLEDATWCLASPRHLLLFAKCPVCEIARLRALLTPPDTTGHIHKWETVSAAGGPRKRCKGCGFLGLPADEPTPAAPEDDPKTFLRDNLP